MKSLLSTLILCTVYFGCSSSYIVSSSPQREEISFEELIASIEGEEVEILFNSGSTLRGKRVVVGRDSMSWVDPGGRRRIESTREINRITFVNHGRGTVEGGGIGLLSGAALGAVVALILVGDAHDGGEEAYFILSAIGGGVGLIVGAIIGGNGGATNEYRFESEQDKP